jgi:hypothetical protein
MSSKTLKTTSRRECTIDIKVAKDKEVPLILAR